MLKGGRGGGSEVMVVVMLMPALPGEPDYRGNRITGEPDYRGSGLQGEPDYRGNRITGEPDYRGTGLQGKRITGGTGLPGEPDYQGTGLRECFREGSLSPRLTEFFPLHQHCSHSSLVQAYYRHHCFLLLCPFAKPVLSLICAPWWHVVHMQRKMFTLWRYKSFSCHCWL